MEKLHQFVSVVDLLIDARTHDYYYSLKDGTGIHLLVHDQSLFPSIDEESFALKPGTEAYVALKKTVRKSLSVPYSSIPCQEPGRWNYKYPGVAISGYTNYSYGACRLDCMLAIMVNKCGCLLRKIEDGGCSMIEYFFCGQQQLFDFYQNTSKSCECPQLCTKVEYHYKLSTLQYPTSFTVDRFRASNMTHWSREYLSKNMISLLVYFQNMEYSVVEEVPATTRNEIIAQIGGQMGLFVGASLITVIEILKCVILVLRHRYLSKNRQKLSK